MSRIVSDPSILGGKPIIEGTRISVEFILECLASGMSEAEILSEYSHLKKEDIQACLKYAADNIKNDVVIAASR
jgi:uncharacterized protein (DUF433 family)